MKRKIQIFLLIIISAGITYSQTSNFSIGPKVGINYSNVNLDDTKNKIGFNAGITSTYSVNESSGVGIDLLYSRQGYKLFDQNFNLDYIKIPLTYKLFFNKLGDVFRPRLEIGVSPGFLVSAKTNGISYKEQLNSSDIGLLGGLGFNYRLSQKMWLNFDLRGDIGLSNVSKDTSLEALKNRNISVNLGVAMGL